MQKTLSSTSVDDELSQVIISKELLYKGEGMSDKEDLIEIIKEKSFKESDVPSFPLSSGKKSKYYFNMKPVTMDSRGAFLIGTVVFDKICELGLQPKAIGGLTMGADPVSIATAYTSFLKKKPIQSFSIRKEPKKHGLGLQIEGNVRPGDKVVIVDDVVTTGKSTINAIDIAREHDLGILAALVLVDRCEENGRENIEALSVPVYSIFTIRDFL